LGSPCTTPSLGLALRPQLDPGARGAGRCGREKLRPATLAHRTTLHLDGMSRLAAIPEYALRGLLASVTRHLRRKSSISSSELYRALRHRQQTSPQWWMTSRAPRYSPMSLLVTSRLITLRAGVCWWAGSSPVAAGIRAQPGAVPAEPTVHRRARKNLAGMACGRLLGDPSAATCATWRQTPGSTGRRRQAAPVSRPLNLLLAGKGGGLLVSRVARAGGAIGLTVRDGGSVRAVGQGRPWTQGPVAVNDLRQAAGVCTALGGQERGPQLGIVHPEPSSYGGAIPRNTPVPSPPPGGPWRTRIASRRRLGHP